MAEDVKIPAVVLKLAEKANGKPLSWYIGETFVTIVFEDGRKLTYDELPAKAERAAEAPQPAKTTKYKKGD